MDCELLYKLNEKNRMILLCSLHSSTLSFTSRMAKLSTVVLTTLSLTTIFSTAILANRNTPKKDSSTRSFFTNSHSNTMQVARNDGMGGRGVTFLPTTGSYSNVVIWLHGLGDTADGWASMMPSLGLDDTKFIVPTAKSQRISINMGMSMPGWFDIYDLDENSPEDEEGFAESSKRINAFIQAEVDKGISPQNIVVAGFSQGGAVALHTTLRSAYSLGGCIALSTWLPFRSQYPESLSPAATKLPVLQVHGDEDQVVSYSWGKGSSTVLKTFLTDPEPKFVTIESMGHSSDPEEIIHVQNFLKTVFKQSE